MEHRTGHLETVKDSRSDVLASTVARLQQERLYALHAIKEFHVPAPAAHPGNFDDTEYPVVVLNRKTVCGLHNLKPGQHGYVLLVSRQIITHLASITTFKLIVDGHDYGKYQASPLIGQSLHGLEFLYLNEQVKIDVIKALSLARIDSARFNKWKEDIISSKKTVPCFFFRCVEQPGVSSLAESAVVELSVHSPQIAFDYRIPGEERRWGEPKDILTENVPALSRSYNGRRAALDDGCEEEDEECSTPTGSGFESGIHRRKSSRELYSALREGESF